MIYSTLIVMEQREQGKELEIKREMYYIKPKVVTPPTPSLENNKSKIRRRSRHKLIILFIIPLVTTLIVAGIIFGFNFYQKQLFINQIPGEIRSSVTFPIYIPRSSEFEVQNPTLGGGVLLFDYVNGSQKLIVSQQAKPADFDLTTFKQGEGLSEVRELQIPAGVGLAGKVLGRSTYIVALDTTLISVIDSSNVGATTIEPLFQNLTILSD